MFLRRTRANAGFTMIESLVAVLVLGVGVLGVANLLANSLRFSQQSTYELVASSLANDMAERMRANAERVRDGGYRGIDTATVTSRGTSLLTNACQGQECALLRERQDIKEWTRRVTASLPGGRGVVCADANPLAPGARDAWNCAASTSGAQSPLVIKLGWVPRTASNSDAKVPSGRGADDGVAVVQLVVVTSPLTGK